MADRIRAVEDAPRPIHTRKDDNVWLKYLPFLAMIATVTASWAHLDAQQGHLTEQVATMQSNNTVLFRQVTTTLDELKIQSVRYEGAVERLNEKVTEVRVNAQITAELATEVGVLRADNTRFKENVNLLWDKVRKNEGDVTAIKNLMRTGTP